MGQTTEEPEPGLPGRGGPRSAATRQAILRAARAQFAAKGYEQATIRAIAADAGIDASMVMRYYDTKAGLFAAASSIDLRLPDLRDVPRARLGRVLVHHFLDRWEGDPTDDALVVLLRSAVTDEKAAERMRAIFAEQAEVSIKAVVAGGDAHRRAALVGAHLLGVALCRHVIHLEPIASMRIEDLVGDVAPSIQAYLTKPLSDRQG